MRLAPWDKERRTPPMDERPRCAGCGKRMRPQVHHTFHPEQKERVRYWTGRYDGYGAFCTLTCATHWANGTVRRAEAGETRLRYWRPNTHSPRHRGTA